MKKTLRLLLFALCMLAAPCGVQAQSLVFHLRGGLKNTVSLPATFTVTPTGEKLFIDCGSSVVELAKDDVMCVTYRGKSGDVNSDQTVDVADISTIIDIMAGKDIEELPITAKEPDNVVAVDLGLPSGTKWANMNVGAESPEEYGLYFAFGETVGYTSNHGFSWANYKWCLGTANTYTRYCTDSSKGTVDNLTTLLSADDAARQNWGGQWRMPTSADMQELIDNTISIWTTESGVNGRKFISKINGNSIFLPAAGYVGGQPYQVGSQGNYRSSSLSSSDGGMSLRFGSSLEPELFSGTREYGWLVRPVLK